MPGGAAAPPRSPRSLRGRLIRLPLRSPVRSGPTPAAPEPGAPGLRLARRPARRGRRPDDSSHLPCSPGRVTGWSGGAPSARRHRRSRGTARGAGPRQRGSRRPGSVPSAGACRVSSAGLRLADHGPGAVTTSIDSKLTLPVLLHELPPVDLLGVVRSPLGTLWLRSIVSVSRSSLQARSMVALSDHCPSETARISARGRLASRGPGTENSAGAEAETGSVSACGVAREGGTFTGEAASPAVPAGSAMAPARR